MNYGVVVLGWIVGLAVVLVLKWWLRRRARAKKKAKA